MPDDQNTSHPTPPPMPTAAISFSTEGAYCTLNGANIGEILDAFVTLSNTVQAFFGTLTDRMPTPTEAPGPNPGVASNFAAEIEAAAGAPIPPRKRGRRSNAEKAEAAAIVDASPAVQRAMQEQRAATETAARAAPGGANGSGAKVHSITALLTAANADAGRGSPAEPAPSVGATKQNVIAALDDYARRFGQPAAKSYISEWLQTPGAALKDVSPDLFDALVDQINQDLSQAPGGGY